MAFFGRLHPVLVHFPIALVVIAAVAEMAAAVTRDVRWHAVAVANLRVGAAIGLVAAVAGWQLASGADGDGTSLLTWHRWLGTIAAAATLAAACAASDEYWRPTFKSWVYRIALFSAALLVSVTGHFGGLMVWGADYLHL